MSESNNRRNADVDDLINKINGYERRQVQMANEILEQQILISSMRYNEERSARLAAIVDSSEDAVISKNLNGIVTSWNHSAERIFGYTSGEIVGHSILKLIPHDRVDEETLILSRLRQGERVQYFQTKRLNKNGTLIDVSLTISPIRSSDGTIIGVSKIARDISDIVLAERKSAMLAAIVASSDDAIISKDLNSIVTSWNKSAERIFGYTSEEMIGQSIVKLIPDDRQQEEPEIIARLKNGQRVDHFETKRVTKNGALLDVSLTISPVTNASGDIIGISKIARDVTDKKLDEQRKNSFVAIVSHELKTPLTSVRSYIQLALAKARERSDVFTENIMSRADTQTRKMVTMIHDFLNLSRLEDGKMTLNISEFSLSDLMNEVVAECAALSPAHTINYEPCDDARMVGDRDKICHVLSNLLGNAVKYSPAQTNVEVRCLHNGNSAEFSITDQGIGISREDQSRLFERFYRVSGQRQTTISGFGIGLYLAAEILRLLHSEISVKSEIGKGSTFSFALPLLAEN